MLRLRTPHPPLAELPLSLNHFARQDATSLRRHRQHGLFPVAHLKFMLPIVGLAVRALAAERLAAAAVVVAQRAFCHIRYQRLQEHPSA